MILTSINSVATAEYTFAPSAPTVAAPEAPGSTELWGWSNPDLPAKNQFLTGIQSSSTDARQAIAQEAGLSLPADWRNMSLDQFLEWAGGNQPATPAKETPFVVHAHSYQNECTRSEIVVRSVTIDEAGDSPQRRETDNPGRGRTVELDYDEAKRGHWYNVTTRWADGRYQVTQVKDTGYPVEVW